MKRRQFGKTDMVVSPLGFGSAEIGFQDVDDGTVSRMLNAALDTGLNVIDTAECYADSEGKIGRALARRRNEYYVFTKCGHASGVEGPDWNPKTMRLTIDRSLERLKTDRLDLLLIHSCDADLLRKGDVIEVLKLAREAGKVRYIGYSGDAQAALYAVESGEFDVLETSVNIADQESIDLILPKAEALGMGVIAKRPVANVAWKAEPAPSDYARVYWERLQELDYDFLRGPLDEAVGTAVRFTLGQPVHVAIVGTTKHDRWATNAAHASRGPLPKDLVDAIRARWHETARPDWVGQE